MDKSAGGAVAGFPFDLMLLGRKEFFLLAGGVTLLVNLDRLKANSVLKMAGGVPQLCLQAIV